MKLANHLYRVLSCSILSSGSVLAQYSGTDPEIVKLQDEIKKLQGVINELQEKDKVIEQKTQSLEDDIKKSAEDLESSKASIKDDINEAINKNEKLADISNKVKAIEDSQTNAQDDKGSSDDLKEIAEKVIELENKLNSSSAETSDKNDEKINELQQAIVELHEKQEEQEQKNAQQDLEAAKAIADLEKLKKQSNSSSKGSILGNLAQNGINLLSSKVSEMAPSVLDSVLKKGKDLISQKLNINNIKQKIAQGQSTEDLTKDFNEEEKAEFEEISQNIKNGENIANIQAKLDKLQDKIAKNKTEKVLKELEKTKFPKLTFFGLNEAFSSINVSQTVARIYDLSENATEAPVAEDILKEPIKQIDREIIETIYNMVKDGATLNDIFDCIGFHTGGEPMKMNTPNSQSDPIVNSLMNIATDVQQTAVQTANNTNSNNANVTPGLTNNENQQVNEQAGVTNAGNQQVNEQTGLTNAGNQQVNEQAGLTNAGNQQVNEQAGLTNAGNQQVNEQAGLTNAGNQQVNEQTVLTNAGNQQVNEQTGLTNAGNQQVNEQTGVTNAGNQQVNEQAGVTNAGNQQVNEQTGLTNAGNQQVNEQAGLTNAGNQQVNEQAGVTNACNQQGILSQTKLKPNDYLNTPLNKTNNIELDEKNMTLMDVANNAYYDVNKHRFMKIATKHQNTK